MKTVEELTALKVEVETLNKKLAELTEEELAQVSGGGKYISDEDVIKYQKTVELGAGIGGRGKNGQPTLVLWDE